MIRAQKGIFINADAQPKAQGQVRDMAPVVSLFNGANQPAAAEPERPETGGGADERATGHRYRQRRTPATDRQPEPDKHGGEKCRYQRGEGFLYRGG